MKRTTAAVAAIGSLLSIGAATFSASAVAADKMDMEKCYGVAKAGKNDCAGAAHSCAGQSKADNGGKDWVSVPKGTCDKLAGGSMSAK